MREHCGTEEDWGHELLAAFMRLQKSLFRFHCCGVTHTMMGALVHIRDLDGGGGVPMAAIAQRMRVSKPAVTRTVQQLVEQGLVVRREDELDRRAVKLRLTDNGRKRMEEVHAEAGRAAGRLYHELGENDARELTRILNRLSAIVTERQEDNGSMEETKR